MKRLLIFLLFLLPILTTSQNSFSFKAYCDKVEYFEDHKDGWIFSDVYNLYSTFTFSHNNAIIHEVGNKMSFYRITEEETINGKLHFHLKSDTGNYYLFKPEPGAINIYYVDTKTQKLIWGRWNVYFIEE